MLPVQDLALDATLQMAPLPVLLAVVSNGCPHCVNLKPRLGQMANKYHGQVQTWALVAEDAPINGPPLSADGVPALLGFVAGQPVWRQVGAPDNATLESMYQDLVRRRAAQPTGPAIGGW